MKQARVLPMIVRGAVIALGGVFVATGCSPEPAQQQQPDAQASMLLDQSDGRDWAAFGRTYGEQHFSPLDQISDANIGQLKLAWFFDLPLGNSVTAPIAINGVLYTATGYSVVRAFEGDTGKLLWEFDPKAAEAAGPKLRQGWGSRGSAYWDGKLFTGTQDGRLIAIDSRTGRELWSQMTVGKDDVRFISGPPRVFAGKVIIGHGGADNGPTRGYVTAFDANSGKQLWRFYTVPGDPAMGFEDDAMRMAAKTWSGQWWKYGGGGTVWNAMTYDAGSDTVIIGTGNGAPWNHRIRSAGKGDNLFLSSLVALDAKTGRYKWHYQTNPAESWDYNAAMDIQLADLTVNGQPRKVLMTAPKNGFFYVIDRTNGKLISAEPIVTVNWATKIDLVSGRPVENPGIRYPGGSQIEMWPGPNGAHNWLPMAFDPRRNIVYIPTRNQPGVFDDRNIDPAKWYFTPKGANDAAVNVFIDTKADGANSSELLAWDVVRQKKVWSIPTPGIWNGGVMATAGNLIFQGHADGRFNAFSSATGKRLWSFDAQTGVIAPPITYLVKGRQYVTVLSGFGTSGALFGEVAAQFGWDARTQPRRVLTFAIEGKASLPPPPPRRPVVAAADPSFVPDASRVQQGAIAYGQRCMICHGMGVIAAGIAPDLRASAVPQDKAAFDAIVRGGALVSSGMPAYGDIPEAETEAARHYIRTAARKLAEKRGRK